MKIFSIGVSGLNSAQLALTATSNNISNAFTPGYHREVPMLEQQQVGGVGVSAIQRQFNQFVAAQLNSSTSNLTGLSVYHAQVTQIDNLLADSKTGLAPLMQQLFAATQDVVGSPSDPAARQGMIGTANALAAQFRSLDAYLSDMQDSLNGQLRSEISSVNNTLERLASLNREITLAVSTRGEAPNSLLNQRDQLVYQLSESLDIRVTYGDGVTYGISLPNGNPLVTYNKAYSLVAVTSSEDPTRVVVGYVGPNGEMQEMAETALAGGRIGGLMAFRREALDHTQNNIGLLAAALALSFNEQHSAGLDLYGEAGADLFAIGAPRLFSHAANAGSAGLSAVLADASGLTGEDYDIVVSDAAGGEFTVTRRDTGASFTAVLDGDNRLAFDGVQLTLNDPALLMDGDRYYLQPTRGVAREMTNLISDPGRIAAGQSGSSGDNRNAQALQDLQNRRVVGGRATFNQAYAGLINEVGIRTNIAELNMAAQQGFNDQIRTVQQSESGVNLDEEAANLIRYQQYYQANAKVIEVASSLFDTILGASR